MNKYLLLLLLISFQSFAQRKAKKDTTTEKSSFIIQPNRIEFEIDNSDGHFQIIPAKENGLLVIKETKNRSRDGFEWNFNLVDSALNIQWIRQYAIPFGSSFLGYDFNGDGFYLLFGKSQYKLEEMRVMRLDLQRGDTTSYMVNTVFPMQLNTFEVIENTIIFGGTANFRPVVMLYDMIEQKPKVLPGFYNNNSDIIDVRTDDKTKTFTVILNEKTYKKKVTVSIKTFDSRGNLLQTKALDADYEKSLIDGVSTTFSNGSQYVAGTYARRKSDYSRGLYLAKLRNGEQELIKYHNYGDLNNFFSYMKVKREKRIKSRIEKRKGQGKRVKFNYRLLVHDIIQRGDEFILIGEAYYPKYSNNSSGGYYTASSNYDYRNLWINPNFIGYNYTHAVVVGFDRMGNILWDNSFEINDVLSLSLQEFVKVSVEEDRIVLLYIYENVLRAKIIEENEIVEGKSFDPIALKFKSDEIKDLSKNMEGMDNWFDGKFYAYGVQQIKNLKDKDVKLNRKVFYINKIEYY
ncbi:hypothetical protein [Reichenbachiella sp. MALMAid0571]|uniref:hypothetical protein n=1 Tax=Reichenbachiella sp. MALMAid0571 TaxID=3143939 RepID=UPI0032DFF663